MKIGAFRNGEIGVRESRAAHCRLAHACHHRPRMAGRTNQLCAALPINAAGNVVGNVGPRAPSCRAAERYDLHVLQIFRLQAQLTLLVGSGSLAIFTAILRARCAVTGKQHWPEI
jgi:hypothetical protein